MEPLKPGMNPREALSNHTERGLEKFTFTYEDLARASGLALSTLHSYGLRKYLVDMDLRSLAHVIVDAVAWRNRQQASENRKASRVLTTQELVERHEIKAHEAPLWENRYPKIDLWSCGMEGCDSTLPEKGLCDLHGGHRGAGRMSDTGPSVTLGSTGYFQIIVNGRQVPLHRFIINAPPGMDVHHKDRNRWNNRPANLQVLTHDQHMTLHVLEKFGPSLMLAPALGIHPSPNKKPPIMRRAGRTGKRSFR